jgi:hypothetical protein
MVETLVLPFSFSPQSMKVLTFWAESAQPIRRVGGQITDIKRGD